MVFHTVKDLKCQGEEVCILAKDVKYWNQSPQKIGLKFFFWCTLIQVMIDGMVAISTPDLTTSNAMKLVCILKYKLQLRCMYIIT